MSLRFRHLQALSLAAALALSACSDSSGPNFEGNFDAAETSSKIATIDAAYSTPAFQAFSALGDKFMVGGGVPAASASLIKAAAQSVTMTDQAKIAADQIANAIAAPAAILIPDEYLGQTYTYNGEYYDVDPSRTDAPATGVRFILYAVNPVTGEIAEPLNEIGWVDLTDLSNDNQASVRLEVVSDSVTYLDYTVTTTGVITAPTFTIAGFITDGETQVTFRLVAGFVSTFASLTLTLNYDISVGDFSITADLSLETDGQGGETVSVLVSFTDRGHTVTVTGSVANDVGTLQVTANGQLFATITFTDTTITVVGADGEALDQDEMNALSDLVEMVGEVFDAWEGLFQPVAFLFEGPQS